MPFHGAIDDYEAKLMRKIMAQEDYLTKVFDDFVTSINPHLRRYNATGKSVWHKNKAIEAAINKELVVLQKRITEYMRYISDDAWKLAAEKTDQVVERYIKDLNVSQIVRNGYFDRNLSALNAFQNRVINGMNLSERVWKICEQTKQSLEYYLKSGIGTGQSAATMSRDVRKLLKDPDARFRRIRDPETGKLKPSVPMKNYHPGQGVYRSAYKNALRMTRTETNMAYRYSDLARWEKLDFITGYQVKLSASHPVYDICDSMVGEYPKKFVFGGWHPNCYCYTVPIMLSEDEFFNYLETEKLPKGKKISNIPPRASKYVQDNGKRLASQSSKPYWLKDNFNKKNGRFVLAPGIKSIPDGTAVKAMKTRASTIPVSDAFESVSPGIKRRFDHAMKAIGKVHGDGKLPKLPVYNVTKNKAQGSYTTLRYPNGDMKPVNITLKSNGQHPELTSIHETGHFLDHMGIKSSSQFASQSDVMKEFFEKAKKSEAYKRLTEIRANTTFSFDGKTYAVTDKLRRHIDYLLSNEEIFARAYAQFITVKSQDNILLEQLGMSMGPLPYQWKQNDFIPLMEEIEKLFKQLGWMI